MKKESKEEVPSITLLVLSEGGVPILSYPRVKEEKENLFSFLLGSITSLEEEMWGEEGIIKLKKGGNCLIIDKKERLFFCFLIDPQTSEEETINLLKNTINEFTTRFGTDPDQLTLIEKKEKEEFFNWLKRKLQTILPTQKEEKRIPTKPQDLGKFIGQVIKKSETTQFTFRVEKHVISRGQFVICVDKEDGRRVLSRVDTITKQETDEFVSCKTLRIIQENTLEPVGRPVTVKSPVYIPRKNILTKIFHQIPPENKLLLGKLMNMPGNIPVFYNIEDFSTHLFIVSSTGGGKSYTLGVLIEELLGYSKNHEDTSLLIFDFHNEFGGLTYPNQDKNQLTQLREQNLSPTSFQSDLLLFNWDWNPLKLKPTFTPQRLKFLSNMPEEYSLYLHNILKEAEHSLNLETIKERVEKSNLHHARKKAIKSRIEGLRNSNLFSKNYFQAKDIIEPGKATLIQLGNIQMGDWGIRFIVADLIREIYQAKLKGELPSNVILFLDEAHKFAPQSSDDPLGQIIHTVTREGRKLGLWLVISTQTSQDLSESVMKNCNSLLALRSPKRQTKVLSRIYGISKENTEVLSAVNPGKGYLKTPSLPFPLMVDIRARKTSETPKKGELKEKIQERVKKTALSTKKRLSHTILQEKVEAFISEHKKFRIEEISDALSLSVKNIKDLLSKLEEEIVSSSKSELFYSQSYWEELKEKAHSLNQKKGFITVNRLSRKLQIPLKDGERLLKALDLQRIRDNVFYTPETVEKTKKAIRDIMNNYKKISLTRLSEKINIPEKDLSIISTEIEEKFIITPSNTLYSYTFWQDLNKKARKILEERIHIAQHALAEQLNISTMDLKECLEDLPITHIQNPQHLYWEPKLEKLHEELQSFINQKKHYTIEEVKNEFHLPHEDAKILTEKLKVHEKPKKEPHQKTETQEKKKTEETAQVILKRIESMPAAVKHIIKILIKNEGKIRTSRALSLVSDETLSYLEQISLISYKRTRAGEFVQLRLDQFLKNYFGLSPTQEIVNKIALRIYKELQ